MNKRIHHGKSVLQSLLLRKRWLTFVRVALVGLIITISLHASIVVALDKTGNWIKADNKRLQIEITSNSFDPSATASPAQLLQLAENRYQAGQYSEAIALWQQAATIYDSKGDRLNQALVLSFQATASEEFGQWQKANEAINKAISLLNTQNTAHNPDTSHVQAQVLTVQGKLQLAQGKATEALQTWQNAEAAYRKANDANGILGSQINQARALQTQGLYRRATTLLTQVEQSLQNQPDSRLKVTGLRNLGKVLRLVGNLAQSRTVLQQSLAIIEKLQGKTQVPSNQFSSDISGILLSLGNTARAQGHRDTALTYYHKAITTAPSLTAKTQIQLVQLSLLVEANRWAEAQDLLPQIQSQLTKLPPTSRSAYARINLAQSLVKMRSKAGIEEAVQSGGCPKSSNCRGVEEALSSHLLSTSAQELATAIQQVRTLGDRRAESYALGTLGNLYESNHQWDSAKTLTQQALSLAQSIDAGDIAYQWYWQLGRIFCQGTQPCTATGNLQNATFAYAEAVKTLQFLRSDLVAINQDVQFSFRENVEPVYRQFVELLLTPSPQNSGSEPSQKNLKQAREVIEALQLAELENFFREACVNTRTVQIDQIDPQAAVIYPIILPNKFAVILSLPNQPLRYHQIPLAQAKVEQIFNQMRQSLRPTAFVEDWLPVAQKVYNLVLRPHSSQLEASGVKTLVFVPDGLLRNLPMATLHDGQQYLIEKYSIVLTPGLQLLGPRPLESQRLKGLLAGLSQARENFPALPNVAVEIDQIEAEIPAQVLLDQSFTNRIFQNRVDSTPVSIVHLATHGQFSSNADDTFILTWDGRINVKQLDKLLRSREGKLIPIELLVLSACQTAAGDQRAALGMAGFAVQSGARSTIASLWSVSDRSTALLMISFYRELSKPGVTKAEALRRAQVALLHQDNYNSPYYWAPFVLLGNWL